MSESNNVDNRAALFLACASFASMASMRVCDTMLPALGQAFNVAAADASVTVSGFALAYGLLQLAYGPLGDRFGKPRVIALALWGSALASLVAAAASSLATLAAARVVTGAFAAGVIPLTMAWIGDRIPYARRQEALARLLTWTILGMMLGAWAGGALAQSVSWRAAFLVAALLFAIPGVGLVGELTSPALRAGEGDQSGYLGRAASLIAAAWTRKVLGVVFAEGALVFGGLAFIPTALHQRLHMPLLEAGALVTLFGVGGLIYTPVAGFWVRQLGAALLAGMGAAFVASGYVLLALMEHWIVGAGGCLLAGLGFHMLHNTLQTCATQLSKTARGTGVSLFVSSLFLGQACGISLAAYVTATYSTSTLFIGASPLLLAVGVYFCVILRGHLRTAEATLSERAL